MTNLSFITPELLQKAEEFSKLTGAPSNLIAPKLATLKAGKEVQIDGTVGSLKAYLGLNNLIEHHKFKSAAPNNNAVGGGGQDEMVRARSLAAYFGATYRYVTMEQPGSPSVLHTFNTTTYELSLANEDLLRAKMREYIGEDLPLTEANAAVTRAIDHMQVTGDYRIQELEIVPLLLNDQRPGAWCYRRLPFGALPGASLPSSFADFLSRVTVPDARRSVVLWLGSLLDPEADRSQCLTLYGQGRNGKSTLLAALRGVLLNAAVGMEASELRDKFSKSKLARRRLAVFDDNNSQSFMSSGDFKRITGSNYLRVEEKGERAYETRNHIKMIVATNRHLILSGDHADLRRSLFVRVSQVSDEEIEAGKGRSWEDAITREGPQILQYCYDQYLLYKNVSGDTRIPVPDECTRDVFENSTQAEAEEWIQKHLIEDLDLTLRPNDLKTALVRERDPQLLDAVRRNIQDRFPIDRSGRGAARLHVGIGFNNKIIP